MYPHISNIIGGNVIGKPFMPAFMDNNKVPGASPTCTGKISSQITISEFIAIGNSTLVFHSQVRGLYYFITVFIKRIGAKPIFKTIEHRFYIAAKLFLRFFKIIIHYPIAAIKVSFFTMVCFTPVYILAYIGNDIVIINRINDLPLPGSSTVVVRFFFF